MMQKVVEIEESGLPLVVRVERSEAVEFAHKPGECGGGDIGPETLISVAAAVIDRFCCGAELLAARLGKSGRARGRLPFPFVLPCLKARLAAVAASWRLLQQKAGEDAPGDGSVEGAVEGHPQSLQIGNALGRRGFSNAAGGIPVGEIAYPFRKTAQDARVQLAAGARAVRLILRKLAASPMRVTTSSGSMARSSAKKSSSPPRPCIGGIRPRPSSPRARPKRADSQAVIKSW